MRVAIIKGFWEGTTGTLTGVRAKSGEYEVIINTDIWGDVPIWLQKDEFAPPYNPPLIT